MMMMLCPFIENLHYVYIQESVRSRKRKKENGAEGVHS